jgi:hypothetical protein
MTNRAPGLSTALAISITALTFAPIVAAGQGGTTRVTKGTGRSTGPRTPWGHPDLQGVWSNATTTPLERPTDLAGKEVLSDEEVARLDREVSGRRNTDQAPRQGDPGTYNEFWWERGNLLKQTALIIEPADGRVPALTPEGQRKVTARAEALKGRGPSDSWEDRNLHERCILYHGVPPLPTGYNNNYQIVQTPEYVVIRYEMLADTRIIPLDGRPHLNSKIRLWMGDPRGHWEGETLVVETTNFNAAAGGLYELGAVTPLQGTGETTRIVERFTRTDANTIDYRFTVDDSTVFTKPWTGSIPLVKFDEKIYEYACHEGNYAMEHILSGARAEEAKSNTSKTNK